MNAETSTSQSTQQFLRFRLPRGVRGMLPMQQLTEILNLRIHQIVPIPDVHSSVLGVCNWRGEVLWLADLGDLLGFEPLYVQNLRRSQSQVSAIVARDGDRAVGLVVAQVEEMVWCETARIQAPTESLVSPKLAPCLRGYWLEDDRETVLVLDGEAAIAQFNV
ncbi:purine-binding chemotaxis protein CheW [Lusitaniella coriacea LEGE 07157]|uniref:Purine-binding chemotaxis protein CheW n=1 Tax=Lusitaniella coriacea LEGE 07157 TaxID=945747 RepID=A0A8J7IW64_9CYAN|nr:chemotaxis protein CheW [Lusitaniella coriacea]MBE9117793.1 purine-binding chemotaxis protein CheW [Lusitaniella coriacea LEGE 07157]